MFAEFHVDAGGDADGDGVPGPRHPARGSAPPTAGERMWHTHDNQGQIPALAFRQNSSKCSKLFPPRLEAATNC